MARSGGIYPDLLRSLANKEGCALNFPIVPRARQEMMYELGLADILLPARRSPRRDGFGLFVPLVQSRAALVSLHGAKTKPAPQSMPDILRQDGLQVAVVRGYDYGEDYQALLAGLRARARLQEAADPVSLVRMLDAGVADLAIVTPTIVTGALRGDPALKAWLPRVQVATIDDLPWGRERRLCLEPLLAERGGPSTAARGAAAARPHRRRLARVPAPLSRRVVEADGQATLIAGLLSFRCHQQRAEVTTMQNPDEVPAFDKEEATEFDPERRRMLAALAALAATGGAGLAGGEAWAPSRRMPPSAMPRCASASRPSS